MSFDHGAFKRAHSMMALIGAAMALPLGERQAQLASLGSYESHGKRKTAVHSAKCCRRDQRAAQKRRNVQRNRRAHRGGGRK